MPLKEGDYVILYKEGKKFLVSLKRETFHTHKGVIFLSDLIGKNYGETIISSLGEPFIILKPTLFDFLMKLKRVTQIIYPKDLGYILLKLGVGEGKVFIECGAGSGALTCALAYFVGREGKIISYEKEERFLEVAKENLKRLGIEDRVIFKHKELWESFEEKEVDGIFLDVREPWQLIKASYLSLKGGHPLGILVPTTNQVSQTLSTLTKWSFVDIEVVEILLRAYKINPERFRPEDLMTAIQAILFCKKAS